MFYRKKPIVIEAIQYTGDNKQKIISFTNDEAFEVINGNIMICTLEGYLEISIDDWVIKGIADEFYPCKPDIFKATYDLE